FNLFSNAIKFTDSDLDHQGMVSLEAYVLKLWDASVRLRFRVLDNGIGMSQETVINQFEPYQQADTTTARRFGGTGLGLSICKRLVDLMDGEITCASVLGEGSELIVTLDFPLASDEQHNVALEDDAILSPAQRQQQLTLPLVAGRKPRILVAEDSATNREVVRLQLHRLGAETVLVDDGARALAAWQQGDIDILLTDCHMPIMDGFALTAAIRSSNRDKYRRTPIVALTANAMGGENKRCIEAGMDFYLPKPTSLIKLHKVLLECALAIARAENNHEAIILKDSGSGVAEAANKALSEIVGPDEILHKKLIRHFLQDLPLKLAAITQALEANQLRVAAQSAHSLKSAARTLGAETLAGLCQRLEQAEHLGDSSHVSATLEALQVEGARVKNSLETWLSR
ncbi:MAG: response regulator, partial [Natronospirillum sp.]